MRIFTKSRQYVDQVRKTVAIKNKADAHKVELLYSARKRLIEKRRRQNLLRFIFYVALYASLISSITSILNLYPFLSKVLDFILTYAGIFGTTFSLIAILLLTHSIRNFDRDITTVESHIIAIHVKYDKTKGRKFEQLIRKIR